MCVRVRVRVRVRVCVCVCVCLYVIYKHTHTGLPRVHDEEDFPDVKLNPKQNPKLNSNVFMQAYHGFMVKKTFQMGLMAAPGTGTSEN